MSDRKAIRSQARKIAANVLETCEEEAKNGVLCIPLSQYRERASKLTGISTRTLSRIKAVPDKEILASQKPHTHTHTQQAKKKKSLIWVRTHYPLRYSLKDFVQCALPTELRSTIIYLCAINCFVTLKVCFKPHVPISSIVPSTYNGIIMPRYPERTVKLLHNHTLYKHWLGANSTYDLMSRSV